MSASGQQQQEHAYLGGFAAQDSVNGGGHTLLLSGELDIAQAADVESVIDRIAHNGAAGITLDLRGLTFIDSTGLRAVLRARDLCRQIGCEFRVVPGPARVQRVFEIAGLNDRLPFQPRAA